jgi:hypothetical protein
MSRPGFNLPTALLAMVVGLSITLPFRPSAAQLERYRALEPPDLLELDGHIGKALPGETGGWELKLGVGFSRTLYDFHLVNMRVLNSGRLPGNILSAVEPSLPNFRLIAPAADLAMLAGATPEQRLKITGYRRLGSSNLMVTQIELLPPRERPPQATPTL